MNPIKKDAATLQEERDYWYREALAAQEMLAQVLTSVGKPVEVKVGSPLPENVGVFIDLDEARGVFVFEVGDKDSRDEEGKRLESS